jgi:hypothetical protein
LELLKVRKALELQIFFETLEILIREFLKYQYNILFNNNIRFFY